MDIFYILTIGSIVGIFVGLIPGVSGSVALIMLTPLLLKLSGLEIIMFYVCMLVVSQYTGSVSALLAGIPGENSSVPTLGACPHLRKKNLINTAVVSTTIGSLIGGVLALVAVFILWPLIDLLYKFYSHTQQIILMMLVIFLVILVGKNKWIINCLMAVFGAILSMLGYQSLFNFNVLTFGSAYLAQGLPTFPVIICLFAIPLIIRGYESIFLQKKKNKEFINWKIVWHSWPSMIRGSVIGWFTGLVPGISFVLSSISAFSIEKKITGKDKNSILKSVISSETANNSGAVSSLIPFLIFGIPIITAEIVINDIVSNKIILGLPWLTQNSVIISLMLAFALANFVGFLASWPLRFLFVSLAQKIGKFFKWFLVVQLLIVCFYLGFSTNQLIYYIGLMLVFLPIGYYIRNFDLLPLIFTFLTFETFFHTAYRWYLISF